MAKDLAISETRALVASPLLEFNSWIACSRVNPFFVMCLILSSGKLVVDVAVGEGLRSFSSICSVLSVNLAWLGNSDSERKVVSTLLAIRRRFLSKSRTHWKNNVERKREEGEDASLDVFEACLDPITYPSVDLRERREMWRNNVFRFPVELKDWGECRRQRSSGDEPRWILPRIFCVPTPLAIPLNLRSTSLIIPHRSAQVWLMIVICAPESTNALTVCPFTLQFYRRWTTFFALFLSVSLFVVLRCRASARVQTLRARVQPHVPYSLERFAFFKNRGIKERRRDSFDDSRDDLVNSSLNFGIERIERSESI